MKLNTKYLLTKCSYFSNCLISVDCINDCTIKQNRAGVKNTVADIDFFHRFAKKKKNALCMLANFKLKKRG